MVSVKMTEADEVQFTKFGPGLAKAQESTAAGIDQHPGSTVDPDHVGRRRPPVIRDGAAGTQDLHRDTLGRRAFGDFLCAGR